MSYSVRDTTAEDKPWVLNIIRGWGADFIMSRGRKVYPAEIEGFYAVDENDERVGLVTFEVTRDQCEIVTLDAFKKFSGVGTTLINRVCEVVKSRGVKRVWLITTNDNLDAIRFYQRRGFSIAAVHVNAMTEARKIKPAIPRVGMHDIPIRDEIEFEITLDNWKPPEAV